MLVKCISNSVNGDHKSIVAFIEQRRDTSGGKLFESCQNHAKIEEYFSNGFIAFYLFDECCAFLKSTRLQAKLQSTPSFAVYLRLCILA